LAAILIFIEFAFIAPLGHLPDSTDFEAQDQPFDDRRKFQAGLLPNFLKALEC
jgi:hypothetical protein